jgi:hypothetical protein
MAVELPQPLLMDQKASHQYWEKLGEQMTYQYKGRPVQFGHPLRVPVSLASEMHQAGTETLEVIKEHIAGRGGITEYMRGREANFGPQRLNDARINERLEERLARGFELPLIYDIILTDQNGEPRPKVVEFQSGIAYSAEHLVLLAAAGYGDEDSRIWYGPENPLAVMRRTKSDLAGGGNITVMDTDPFVGVDQVGMAKILGEPDSLPISTLDVERDSRGYYHFGYAVDEKTGGPIRNEEGTGYVRTDEKVRIEHAISRMTQLDMDALFEMVKGDTEKLEVIRQFLLDSDRVNWVWHPNWQYIISKDTLPIARAGLLERNSKYAEHYVPVYQSGEIAGEGVYVKKPTNAVSGMGQSEVVVPQGQILQVEEGYVYQQRFTPYPVPVRLPTHLRNSFVVPPNASEELKSRFHREQDETPGTLEVRYMPPPYSTIGLSGWFLARLAPRWNSRDDASIMTQTNLGKITDAMYEVGTVNEHTYKEYPFGWCPVVVY